MQDNWSSMLEQLADVNHKAVAAASHLNRIAARTQGLLARQQLDALETCLSAGTEQLKLAMDSRDPKCLLEGQVKLATTLGETLAASAQQSLEIQAEARDELVRWFESGMRASPVTKSRKGDVPRKAVRRGTKNAA